MNRAKKSHIFEIITVLVLINALGFPGNYKNIYGESFEKLISYGIFALEIGVLLLSSADNFMNIVVINLKPRYKGIYIYTAVISIESILVTSNLHDQAITMIRLTALVFFVLWVSDRFSVEKIVELICIAQIFIIFSTIVLMVMYPDYAFHVYEGEKALTGLCDAKNPCATEFAVGILILLLHFRDKRESGKKISILWIGILVIQIFLFVRCNSIGTVFAFAVTAIYIFLIDPLMGKNFRIPLGWLFVLGSVTFLVVALTVLQAFSPVFELFGKDATLTGRVPLWNQLITIMSENKTLTGYGFSMFWRDSEAVDLVQKAFKRYSYLGNISSSSHNLLLELWCTTGLLGVTSFFYMVLDSFKKINELEKANYLFCCAIFLLFTIHGLTERMMSSAHTYDVFLTFLALAVGSRRKHNTLEMRKYPLRTALRDEFL